MNRLVGLRIRPSRDGKTFKYMLDYVDEDGRRHRISLGHADRRKAERQRAQTERELRMGVMAPESMRLSELLQDSIVRTGNQVRKSTQDEYRTAMNDFIKAVGDIDYQRVTMRHGELYRQALLDSGNNSATVIKKLKAVKRIFQLAVERGQLDENPLRRVKSPKAPKKKIEIYDADECERILKAAQRCRGLLRWDLLVALALETAMRKGELLNLVWADIDFDKAEVNVSPKPDTSETWRWDIKDVDRRTIPVTQQMIDLLVDHQSRQREGYPYVFIPAQRYDYIQGLRLEGKKAPTHRQSLITNFNLTFTRILRWASVRPREFHDLRSTCITNWLYSGVKEHEVMRLAGHSSFQTTHTYYLAVQADVFDRARAAATKGFGEILARTWRAPHFADEGC